jgi:hypothetical protein
VVSGPVAPRRSEDLQIVEARPLGIAGRPLGLFLVAAIRLIHAVTMVAIATGQLETAVGAPLASLVGGTDVTRVVLLVIAVLDVIAAVGLLALHRWGWVLSMALTGLALLSALIARYNGYSDDLIMLLNVIAAFYLNQRAVRQLVLGPGHSVNR